MSPISLAAALRSHLSATVATFEHPAANLPTDAGRVAPAAVVALHVPRDSHRMAGRRATGTVSATVHCVGSTADECLDVAVRVREALDGYRLTARAGTAREDAGGGLEPAVNPDANPTRFEIPLVFIFPL